jgi:hypothetical protein
VDGVDNRLIVEIDPLIVQNTRRTAESRRNDKNVSRRAATRDNS